MIIKRKRLSNFGIRRGKRRTNIFIVIPSKLTLQRTAGLKPKENQLPERRPDAFQAVVEGSGSCKTRCFDYGRILLALRSARLNIRLHCFLSSGARNPWVDREPTPTQAIS